MLFFKRQESKGKPQTEREYFQKIYLTKNLQLDYIKNS